MGLMAEKQKKKKLEVTLQLWCAEIVRLVVKTVRKTLNSLPHVGTGQSQQFTDQLCMRTSWRQQERLPTGKENKEGTGEERERPGRVKPHTPRARRVGQVTHKTQEKNHNCRVFPKEQRAQALHQVPQPGWAVWRGWAHRISGFEGQLGLTTAQLQDYRKHRPHSERVHTKPTCSKNQYRGSSLKRAFTCWF